MSLEDEDFYYLKKGLKYMAHLQVSRQNTFTPAHFTRFFAVSQVCNTAFELHQVRVVNICVYCYSMHGHTFNHHIILYGYPLWIDI